MPEVIIFAGANGSGKTTLAQRVVKPGLLFINADQIQLEQRLSDIPAGKKALRLIDEITVRGIDFAFETTMAGVGLLKRMERLERKKYHITIYYLFVYPVELLVERIKERVKKGGHEVAEEDIRRRYGRSAYNFWNTYRLFADSWVVFNNALFQYKEIAVGSKGHYEVIGQSEFEKIMEVIRYEK